MGIGLTGVCRVDGPGGALGGAQAAAGAAALGFGDQAAPAGFLIGMIAGDGGRAAAAPAGFVQDPAGDVLLTGHVLGVGAARGILVEDGMLGDGGHPGDDLKTAPGGGIGQLDEGILIGAVAVDADHGAAGAAA